MDFILLVHFIVGHCIAFILDICACFATVVLNFCMFYKGSHKGTWCLAVLLVSSYVQTETASLLDVL